ncbi:hypothetical protein HanPI659440_Chr13g0519561 [Helianthus annuus]|nr:hypothetical protein HanPI659440_Chr13g0519561 [Helianthus annuus]
MTSEMEAWEEAGQTKQERRKDVTWIQGECREPRMKIKRRARTEHALNEASASCFVVILIRRIKSHYVVSF